MQRKPSKPQGSPSKLKAQPQAQAWAARTALYRSSILRIALALGYRLLTYNTLLWLRSQQPALNQVLSTQLLSQAVGLFQAILYVGALLSDAVRRYNPSALLTTLAVLSGISAAIGRTDLSEESFDKPLFEEGDLGGLRISWNGFSPGEFMQVSLNTQPSVFVSVPVATLAALALPLPGSHLLAPLAAAIMPYCLTKGQALAAGWEDITWAASIGSALSGFFSLLGCWWLLSTTWKLSGSRSMTGIPFQLTDPQTGRNPEDAAYVAAWSLVHFLLAPLWVIIFAARWWLWALSCGLAFGRQPLQQ